MFDAKQQKLIMSVLSNNPLRVGKVSDKEFILQFPVTNESIQDFILDKLRDTLADQSHNDLEYILYLGFHFGFTVQYVHFLNELLKCKWHRKHEDIVRALVLIKSEDNDTVDSLTQCVLTKFDYLSEEREGDNYSLAWNCIYALAKIGTPYAVEKLRKIACSDITEVRDKVLKVMNLYSI